MNSIVHILLFIIIALLSNQINSLKITTTTTAWINETLAKNIPLCNRIAKNCSIYFNEKTIILTNNNLSVNYDFYTDNENYYYGNNQLLTEYVVNLNA